jgi:hypothetical protein
MLFEVGTGQEKHRTDGAHVADVVEKHRMTTSAVPDGTTATIGIERFWYHPRIVHHRVVMLQNAMIHGSL